MKDRGGLGHGFTVRITFTRTTKKYVRKLAHLPACRASHSPSQAQPNAVDIENHVFERVKSPMRALQKPEGDAHGAGNKEIK